MSVIQIWSFDELFQSWMIRLVSFMVILTKRRLLIPRLCSESGHSSGVLELFNNWLLAEGVICHFAEFHSVNVPTVANFKLPRRHHWPQSWEEVSKFGFSKLLTEDEMVGWHHRLNGHEIEQALGDGEGEGTWCAVVHAVTKSQTRLNDWTATTKLVRASFHTPGWGCDHLKPVTREGRK